VGFGDAFAGIGDLDQHVVAGRHLPRADRPWLSQRQIGGADRHGAALGRDRIARVDHQIDDGVGDLPLIDANGPKLAHVIELENNLFAKQAAQKMRKLRQRVAQRQDFRLQGLLA